MPDIELEPTEQRDVLHGLAALQLCAAVAGGCVVWFFDRFTDGRCGSLLLAACGITPVGILSSLALLTGRSRDLRRWFRSQRALLEIRMAIACVFASLAMGGAILILVLLSSIPSSGP